MAGSPFVMNPYRQAAPTRRGASTAPQPPSKTCPFGANCSCVFARVPAAGDLSLWSEADAHSDTVRAEVASWTDRGWHVTSTTPRRIVLEREMKLSFCVNAALCVVTGLLWLAVWIPRARHPKIDTRIVTLFPDGELSTSRLATAG